MGPRGTVPINKEKGRPRTKPGPPLASSPTEARSALVVSEATYSFGVVMVTFTVSAPTSPIWSVTVTMIKASPSS